MTWGVSITACNLWYVRTYWTMGYNGETKYLTGDTKSRAVNRQKIDLRRIKTMCTRKPGVTGIYASDIKWSVSARKKSPSVWHPSLRSRLTDWLMSKHLIFGTDPHSPQPNILLRFIAPDIGKRAPLQHLVYLKQTFICPSLSFCE